MSLNSRHKKTRKVDEAPINLIRKNYSTVKSKVKQFLENQEEDFNKATKKNLSKEPVEAEPKKKKVSKSVDKNNYVRSNLKKGYQEKV